MDLRAFVEFLRYQAGGPQAAPIGKQSARFTYLTVETADGKRVLARDLTKARPRRSSDRAHEPSGEADVCPE